MDPVTRRSRSGDVEQLRWCRCPWRVVDRLGSPTAPCIGGGDTNRPGAAGCWGPAATGLLVAGPSSGPADETVAAPRGRRRHGRFCPATSQTPCPFGMRIMRRRRLAGGTGSGRQASWRGGHDRTHPSFVTGAQAPRQAVHGSRHGALAGGRRRRDRRLRPPAAQDRPPEGDAGRVPSRRPGARQGEHAPGPRPAAVAERLAVQLRAHRRRPGRAAHRLRPGQQAFCPARRDREADARPTTASRT